MLRSAIATLRQPRYAALSALMLVIALACIGAGTWQIVRFEGKVAANNEIDHNAAANAVSVATVLPLTDQPAPDRDAIQLRNVTATGHYDAADQVLVAGREVDTREGYLVVTPFVTSDATLLVVRGFVQERANGDPLPVAAPPSDTVTIHARVVAGESGDEAFARGRVASINPGQQAERLGRPVYAGYAEVVPKQPGGTGLTVLPGPDLSNPAGGALEPQHFAYIVQWYIFALLALAAPFAMARAERREQRAAGVTETPETAAELRAAKLADRYGRAVH